MPDAMPEHLRIEVKTSRTSTFILSARDIEGITPGGFAAILLTERRFRGPRWILAPAHLLQPGANSQEALAAAAEEGRVQLLTDPINTFWSNWILDAGIHEILFRQKNMSLQEAVRWCLGNNVPRENNTSGAVRETKLVEALEKFRSALDTSVESGNGSQQEGFVHQCLLEHAFRGLGYDVTNNPIGVPDFDAHLHGVAIKAAGEIRQRLRNWNPEDETLDDIRDRLLALDDINLEEIAGFIKSL